MTGNAVRGQGCGYGPDHHSGAAGGAGWPKNSRQALPKGVLLPTLILIVH